MAIQTKLATLEVGVLVNNVGVSYHYPEYLVEVPNKDKLFPSIINCNVGAVTQMTQIVLPGMLSRGRGLVVNVSSTVALIPSPLLTVYAASKVNTQLHSQTWGLTFRGYFIIIREECCYSSLRRICDPSDLYFSRTALFCRNYFLNRLVKLNITFSHFDTKKYRRCFMVILLFYATFIVSEFRKWVFGVNLTILFAIIVILSCLLPRWSLWCMQAYVIKFSRDLANEYRRKGIVVQCVTPGYVATKMSKIGRPSWMAPDPMQYVTSALRSVGLKENTTGYFPHSLMVWISTITTNRSLI